MEYLGDGLYAEFDGFHVRLFASDGENTSNEVFLEPEVFAALIRWTNANVPWGNEVISRARMQ